MLKIFVTPTELCQTLDFDFRETGISLVPGRQKGASDRQTDRRVRATGGRDQMETKIKRGE